MSGARLRHRRKLLDAICGYDDRASIIRPPCRKQRELAHSKVHDGNPQQNAKLWEAFETMKSLWMVIGAAACNRRGVFPQSAF